MDRIERDFLAKHVQNELAEHEEGLAVTHLKAAIVHREHAGQHHLAQWLKLVLADITNGVPK
jgi:hypothetical protein